MRQVDAAAQITLDGVMQAPGAPEEDPSGRFAYACWAVPYLDDVLGEAAEDGFTKPFGLLLGRRTYEIFAGHWPYDEGRYSSGGRMVVHHLRGSQHCKRWLDATAKEPR